jgi:hypothetical protein
MTEAILLVGQARDWCGIAGGRDRNLCMEKTAASTLLDAS